jgi:hypothetical protein
LRGTYLQAEIAVLRAPQRRKIRLHQKLEAAFFTIKVFLEG